MAKASANGRPAKLKQKRLPGLEPESIPALDSAAETYFDAKEERVRMSREEDEAKDNLIYTMIEHKLDKYETPDGLVVDLLSTKKVKCKRKKEGSEAD